MATIENVAKALRGAGLTVQARRNGPGSAEGVAAVDTRITRNGAHYEASLDLNGVVLPSGGVAYVQRDGTVWLLAEGPRRGHVALVFVAAATQRGTTATQDAVLPQVVEALEAEFGLTDPDDDTDDE